MKFVCRYKNYSQGTTFYVDVKEIDLKGFAGPYTTTLGKSTKVSYNSWASIGRWSWNEVNCVRIKETTS